MIARLRVHSHEIWHHDVVKVDATDREYLTLDLASYPHRVHYWRGNGHTSVLLCATGEDVTAVLREEQS